MEIKNLERIGFGAAAEVFKLDNKRVIKVPRYIPKFEGIEQEFYIQQQLFNQGIKVPEPLELLIIHDRGLEKNSMIMEYIDGKYPTKTIIPIEKKVILQKIYEREIRKCQKLGFKTFDEGLFNSVYSEKRGLFLIDFEGWKYSA